MTFLDLQKNVYRKCGFADSPSTEVSTRVKMFLNEIHRRVLGIPGMDYLRVGTTSFATVANVSRYGLPYDVARIMAMRDTTNDLKLTSETFQWYTEEAPDPSTATGNPEVWVPIGVGPVRYQPANESTLYAISTGADTPTIYVEGISGGNLTTFSVAITGTTKKSLGTWSAINKLYVSAAATGLVSVWEDDATTSDGGTLLATLPIGQTHFRYQTVALWPTPSSALTLTVDYLRTVMDLVNGTDEPLLPEDFHWVLSSGARMLEYEKQDDSRYSAAKAEYEKGLRDLKWFVTQRADGREPIAGTVRGSRLGPWYPRGS